MTNSDDDMFQEAINDLENKLNSDHMKPDFGLNVTTAAERLRAVMERMRMKINGELPH